MRFTPASLLLGLSATALLCAPAWAQPIDDPQIKFEFGQPVNGARAAIEVDDGVKTAGLVRLGPNQLRLQIENDGRAVAVRRGERLHGVEVGFSMKTTVQVPLNPDGTVPTNEEIERCAELIRQKTVFESALEGELQVTRVGADGRIDGRLGEETDVTAWGAKPVNLHLGLVKVKLLPVGAITEGGASARGMAAFEVEWTEGSMMFGAGANLNLPRALGGKGVAGGMIIEVRLNTELGAELRALRDFAEQKIRELVNGLKRAGRAVKDWATNYRGPTTKTTDERIGAPSASATPRPVGLTDPTEIAQRYAPVIYQQMTKKHDLLRKVNFDGDWNTRNNWENSSNRDADNKGYVYFDVKQTETHYFVTYALYYARRSGGELNGHENDMAGIQVMARKVAAPGHEIEMVLTSNGKGTRFYASDSVDWSRRDLQPGKGFKGVNLQGEVNFVDEASHPGLDRDRTHPQIWVTGRNHNVYAFNGRDDVDVFSGKAGVVYSPNAPVAVPTPSNATVGYTLLPMAELQNAEDIENGRLQGNNGLRNDAARLPQAWETHLKGIEDGAFFSDPAAAMSKLFDLDRFSTDYTRQVQGLSAIGDYK